jgi:hypothetical protein
LSTPEALRQLAGRDGYISEAERANARAELARAEALVEGWGD